MKRGTRTAVAVLVLAGLGAGTACSVPDPSRYTVISPPSLTQFAGDGTDGVYLFLEKQCGTLDCHGQEGRPFRLYGHDGLRLPDAGLASNLQPTTANEIYADYISAIGLEPEEMNRVTSGEDPPTALLLVAKPRGLQHHKGGTRFIQNSNEDVCLSDWLAAPSGVMFDPTHCALAAADP